MFHLLKVSYWTPHLSGFLPTRGACCWGVIGSHTGRAFTEGEIPNEKPTNPCPLCVEEHQIHQITVLLNPNLCQVSHGERSPFVWLTVQPFPFVVVSIVPYKQEWRKQEKNSKHSSNERFAWRHGCIFSTILHQQIWGQSWQVPVPKEVTLNPSLGHLQVFYNSCISELPMRSHDDYVTY